MTIENKNYTVKKKLKECYFTIMLNVIHHITWKRFQEQEKETNKTLDLYRDGNAR